LCDFNWLVEISFSRIEIQVEFCLIEGEFDKWLTEEEFNPQSTDEMNYDEPYSMKNQANQMILTHRGTESGGYLDYVFRSAAKELFNVDIDDKPLEFKTIRQIFIDFQIEKHRFFLNLILEIKIFARQF